MALELILTLALTWRHTSNFHFRTAYRGSYNVNSQIKWIMMALWWGYFPKKRIPVVKCRMASSMRGAEDGRPSSERETPGLVLEAPSSPSSNWPHTGLISPGRGPLTGLFCYILFPIVIYRLIINVSVPSSPKLRRSKEWVESGFFLVRPRKKNLKVKKTQEFSSSKKLKLKPKSAFFGILVEKI